MRDTTVPVLLKEPGGDARPTMIPGPTGRGGGAGLTDATSKRETPDCAARGRAVTARPTRSRPRRVIRPPLHRDSTAVRRSCPRVRERVTTLALTPVCVSQRSGEQARPPPPKTD